VFGAMMLAVAVWMLARILPERLTLALWAIPLLALAIVFFRSGVKGSGSRTALRATGVLASAYGAVLVFGAAQGATDPLRPLQVEAPHAALPFQRIKSTEDLDAQVAQANAAGKTVMLDFYADWCVSCKEMEKYTFPESEVRDALANTVWLQADVTANDEIDQALMKRLNIFGPPTIAFFGTDGVERRNFRHSGFMKAAEFAPLVTKAFN
jgi:thioredoxin:protein disulfide reductase